MKQSSYQTIYQNERFHNVNYAEKDLSNRAFIRCTFLSCNFQGCDLSRNDFVECQFAECNLTQATVREAGFRDVVFSSCKIVGIDFSACNKFMFSFEFADCVLDYSIFFGTKLIKTKFANCSLKETDFEGVDLTSAIFEKCRLDGATFVGSILENADFRTALNFEIDPNFNRMHNAKFSELNLKGLLDRYKLDIEISD